MRKKKHLADRLAAVADYLYISDSDDRNFNTAVAHKDYLDLDTFFAQPQPLVLEIGCGKGRFAIEYAKAHPKVNLLAVEKTPNVIVTGCEQAQALGLGNLRFLKCGAEYLERHLQPDSVTRLFLNFSCPFPKNSYAAHRLTHARFLAIYNRLLKSDAEIHQKTDNRQLFAFSIEQLTACGWALKNVSLDLHAEDWPDNIMTEYEERFVRLGQPIYRLEAYRK